MAAEDGSVVTPKAAAKVPEISPEERLQKSEQFKTEGNDAFKAADYNKAIMLYTQALGKALANTNTHARALF